LHEAVGRMRGAGDHAGLHSVRSLLESGERSSLHARILALGCLAEHRQSRSAEAAAAAEAAERNEAAAALQVGFCRDRFPPTGELKYRGTRGAVGLGYRSTV
jgi:hypothetical protein